MNDLPVPAVYGPYGAIDACRAPVRRAASPPYRREVGGWVIHSPSASIIDDLAGSLPSPVRSRS